MKYNVDTSGDGKADTNFVDNEGNSYILSTTETNGKPSTNTNSTTEVTTNTVAGSTTGENASWIRW